MAGFLRLAKRHRHSHRHPVGGIQSLPDALTRRLRRGAAMCDSTRGSPRSRWAAVGRLASRWRTAPSSGRGVLSSLGVTCPVQLFTQPAARRLAVPDAIKAKIRAVPVKCGGYGQMKVDMAFKGQLQLTRHERWRGGQHRLASPMHVIGTAEGVRRVRSLGGRAAALRGRLLVPGTRSRRASTRAGAGPAAARLLRDRADAPEGGWTEEAKRNAGQAIVNKFATFYDGVSGAGAHHLLNVGDVRSSRKCGLPQWHWTLFHTMSCRSRSQRL